MKLKMFNKGKGWYTTANNYKDKTDKAYLNLFFPQNSAPVPNLNEQGYAMLNIEVVEGKFNSYQKQVKSMTIFKYNLIDEAYMPNYDENSIPAMSEEDKQEYGKIVGDPLERGYQSTLREDGRDVTGHINANDDLPFY